MNDNKIVIVGAGITGLSAARKLREYGLTALVLDSEKDVGGRMATLKLDKGQADHGAQSFTAKNNLFVTLKNQWLRDETIREWYRGLPAPHEVANIGIYPRYCGVSSMSAVAGRLSDELQVKTSAEVIKISESNDGWLVETKKAKFNADAVILTAPAPQSIKLLESGGVELDEHIVSELKGLTYHPCITLIARFEQQSKLPAPGMFHLSDGNVEWLSDNQQKGISDVPVLTMQCDYHFSAEHFEETDERLTGDILQSAREWLPGDPVETLIHRWRYSKPRAVASRPCLVVEGPAPVVFAGDAFVDGRIEGAYLSGQAAALAILRLEESKGTKTPTS
jgi:hypothetical protein